MSPSAYQHLVRTWQLAEFIVDRIVKPSPPRWIAYQRRSLPLWRNVVVSTEGGLVGWHIDHIDSPLSRTDLSPLLQSLHTSPDIHHAILAVDHTQIRSADLDLMLVNGLAKASRIARGKLPRFAPDRKEYECLAALCAILTNTELDGSTDAPSRLDDKASSTAKWGAEERALEEIVEIFNQYDPAVHLVESLGFPGSRLPSFTTPVLFWSKVFREARNGLLPGGVRPILEAAARQYPHNPSLAPYHRAGPSWPIAHAAGSAQLEHVFQLLGRFEVHVLYEGPDVRQRAVRALHHVFEEPERLVEALLEFVSDPGSSGVQLHFDVLHDQVLRGFARRTAPWVPVPAGPPDEEVLLWRRDSRGKARTLWLSTKEPGLIVADIPGMVLGSERYLWRWDACSVLVPFGDAVNFGFEGDQPFDESTVELLPVQSARLINLENGATLPLGVIEDFQSDQWVDSLEHAVEPIGTLSSMFLSWAHAGGYSGGAHGWHAADFMVVDLESGQAFDIIDESEAREYLVVHGDLAKRQLQDRELAADIEDESPTITICTPYYDDSFKLRLRLQLTFETCYADTDESWDDEHTSTTVETDDLPATLASLATAPAVLRAYWDQYPKDERCGWTRVPSTGRARELLESLVREHRVTNTRTP